MDLPASTPVLHEFHPAVRRWFEERLGAPSPPQIEGWPHIRAGRHTLIAAPTGSGKTLAAFLSALDGLLRQGDRLADETQVLYVSPLKALSNDVQKNLSRPLAEIRALDPALPELRVLVRTGDTTASERASMTRRPPHVLVTTPESLYILLTSEGGRSMLRTVRTVIVDEIHSLARDKRGSHAALSLERLEALAGPVQRIGLSATQKPIEEVARFLVGVGRECALVDVGHLRTLDLAVEIPASPLGAVCSLETWEEIYERMAELIREHRTTLLFVTTRKLAERLAARLTERLGPEQVTCHHGSLAKERRLDAEQRLKEGKLKALVATASMELGLDIGDIDLVLQVGASRSIATLLQRVGRAGHGLARVPKGRILPLTIDELVEAAALLRAVREGQLDRTPQPGHPLDVLAQQIVASCVPEAWDEDTLFERMRRAWPYRDLERGDFDSAIGLHTQGRFSLLHRDGVNRRVRATKRARIRAVTGGGAIPDNADYQVRLEPEGALVGTLNEDFAIESSGGDVFQLGNASWRILRVDSRGGIVWVAEAPGAIPTVPFWFGEAPSRTRELSTLIGSVRESFADEAAPLIPGLPEGGARQIGEHIQAGVKALGCLPTARRVVAERFFDESGGMQLVLHAPFGGRINRAWGLALRKRFCRGFGQELQAAANEEAIVLSLGPQTSFPLHDVFDFLHPNSARDVLIQALLAAPMFTNRWRWNLTRSLLLARMQNGKRVPAPILRMRADDFLAQAFPEVTMCPENLPAGSLPIPMEHPIVRQTIEDCLCEAMDVDGYLEVIQGLRDGTIERVAVDTAEPSAFARGILSAQPYAFLDDALLEERRTQAVASRRALDPRDADEIGALDPEAIARVREEAWPAPENAEEIHEALLWMGYVTTGEARAWAGWLEELRIQGRVVCEDERWRAVEASRDPLVVLRGRLEALGPIVSDDPHLPELEAQGVVLRTRFDGQQGWCERRLLARIHRSTIDRLRSEIAPVSAAELLRFLAAWQHVDEAHRLEGPRGVVEVVRQLAGFEIPAAAWEAHVLPARVRSYRREWLDQATLSGEVAWGRLWGGGASAIRTTPICLVPRDQLDEWTALAGPPPHDRLSTAAATLHDAIAARGALFPQELARTARLLPSHVELGVGELIGLGRITCDAFAGLRQLIVPPSRRRRPVVTVGRWSLFRRSDTAQEIDRAAHDSAHLAEFVARQLLRRTGVVFRQTIQREKIPVPWRDLVRVFRRLELKGEVRGGRFVARFSGEQYALPEAVELLRAVRRAGETTPIRVAAADPLNFRGILTPDERVSPQARQTVMVG